MIFSDLKDKTFLVTGASSGIGKGVVKELLNQEAKVIGIARDASKISGIKDNSLFSFISMDLRSINNIEECVSNTIKKYGKLDGFVHCAGVEETTLLTQYKTEKVKSIFDINVFSGIELLRVVTKKKYINTNSSIVFLSSVMSELGEPGKVGYCATKSAILGVVKASSLELVRRRIRVNSISPGLVKTPLSEKMFNTLSEDSIEDIKRRHPLGLGDVEDVVPMILMLLSEKTKWITGQNIIIDGGYSIH